jgi:hypothetical protein
MTWLSRVCCWVWIYCFSWSYWCICVCVVHSQERPLLGGPCNLWIWLALLSQKLFYGPFVYYEFEFKGFKIALNFFCAAHFHVWVIKVTIYCELLLWSFSWKFVPNTKMSCMFD